MNKSQIKWAKVLLIGLKWFAGMFCCRKKWFLNYNIIYTVWHRPVTKADQIILTSRRKWYSGHHFFNNWDRDTKLVPN